jgi:hypothetical protein
LGFFLLIVAKDRVNGGLAGRRLRWLAVPFQMKSGNLIE